MTLSVEGNGSSRRSLELTLKSEQSVDDSLPSFADQTRSSEESQIQQIADVIRHEQFGITKVGATDILDSLFVGRFLRLSAPDARLAFFDSDLLLTHSDYPSLEGSLLITPYPLLPGRRPWMIGSGSAPLRPFPWRPFSSQFEEGIYNATSAVIAKEGEARPYLQDTRMPEVNPDGTSQPPLWLAVVGQDESWPIAILNDPADMAQHKPEEGKGQSDPSRFTDPLWPVGDITGLAASSWRSHRSTASYGVDRCRENIVRNQQQRFDPKGVADGSGQGHSCCVGSGNGNVCAGFFVGWIDRGGWLTMSTSAF